MNTGQAAADPAPDRRSWSEAAAVYFRRDVLVVLFLGFSAGLPLALSGSTLLVWMAESSVDLKTIGFFALVGTPYTIKFLWAPVVDAIDIPVLCRLFGRRRGWLIFSQIMLMIAIVFLGFQNPDVSPFMIALGAVLVALASATQDIVIDTYRVEKLETEAGQEIKFDQILMLGNGEGVTLGEIGPDGLRVVVGEACRQRRLDEHPGAGRRGGVRARGSGEAGQRDGAVDGKRPAPDECGAQHAQDVHEARGHG